MNQNRPNYNGNRYNQNNQSNNGYNQYQGYNPNQGGYNRYYNNQPTTIIVKNKLMDIWLPTATVFLFVLGNALLGIALLSESNNRAASNDLFSIAKLLVYPAFVLGGIYLIYAIVDTIVLFKYNREVAKAYR